jgi:MATE family multidrug resistance protein
MSERSLIARHAGTLLAGQLAVMAFGVTDTIVAGRYSQEALAALAVGSAVYISIFVAMMGILTSLLPIWAELHGAGRGHEPELGRSVRQALYLVLITSIGGVVALLFPGPLLDATGVPAAMQSEVRQYLAILALALPPGLLFRMYSTLNQSLGRPQLVTWLQVAGLVLKVPLSVWFAFGGLGVPASGALGCAWASVVVFWLMLVPAVWLVRSDGLYLPYAIWQRMEPPDWHAIRRFARLGIPAGLTITVEVTSFTLMALFIARQGTLSAAAHQVASNLAAVMFMVPLSLGIAISARVSYWLGAGDPKKARATIRTGLRMGLGLAIGMAIVLALVRHGIAAVYASDREVAALAAGLLAWLALYHLGDATQGILVFILRCYRVTLAPLVAYCVLLWGVGLAGGYVLAYEGLGPWTPMPGPAAFWIASAFALAVLSVILAQILWRAARAPRRA